MQVSVKNTDVPASILTDHSPITLSCFKNEESNRGRSSIVCEVNKIIFLHKTITSNNQPNIFYKQKKITVNQIFPYKQKKAFNQHIFKQLSKHLIHLEQKLPVTSQINYFYA